MKWVYVAIAVFASTTGDLLSAHGMAIGGEIEHFDPRHLLLAIRYMVTNPFVLGGIIANAISFFAFLALLTVSDVSFAVPATALGYILKTVLAKWYLHEEISWRRWVGAAAVAVGIVLISV